jgi:hypothetical protein
MCEAVHENYTTGIQTIPVLTPPLRRATMGSMRTSQVQGVCVNANLDILAFAHRSSFKNKMFGTIGRQPNAEERSANDMARTFRHFIDVYEKG